MHRSTPVLLVMALLLPLGALAVAPAAAQEPPQAFVLEDPTGDPTPLSELPLPVGAPWPQVDIAKVVVDGETPSTYRISVTMAGRIDPQTTATEAAALNDLRCQVAWNFNEETGVLYSLRFDLSDPFAVPGEEPGEIKSSVWREIASADRPDLRVYPNAATTRWVAEEATFVSVIKKVYTEVGSRGTPPALGDRMTGIHASCGTDVAALVPVVDNAPDGGGPADGAFAFHDPGPGRVVQVSFPVAQAMAAPDLPPGVEPPVFEARLGFAGGVVAVVPVLLQNKESTPQRVSLTPSVFDDQHQQLTWNLTMAPDVNLDAGESRTVNLIVVPPTDVALDLTGRIQVDVRTPAGDPGRAARDFVIAPLLTPEQNRLNFHSRHAPTTDTPADQVLDRLRDAWDVTLSQQTELAGWDGTPVPVEPVSRRVFSASLPPLARPTRLDANGIVEAGLMFTGSGTRVSVSLTLQDAQHGAIFHYAGLVEPGAVFVAERAVPAEEPLVLAAGSELRMQLHFQQAFEEGVGVDIAFDPTQSYITLPVLPVAPEDRVVTDGRYAPGVHLEPGERSEIHMNPGKTAAFAMKLANEGAETDELTLSMDFGGAGGWTGRFLPGERFRISPGNATPFGIEVKAPPNAGEATYTLTVTAKSKFDPLAVSRLTLTITTTSGEEIPETFYLATGAEYEPVNEEKKKSPGLGQAALLTVAVALAAVCGRRGRRPER